MHLICTQDNGVRFIVEAQLNKINMRTFKEWADTGQFVPMEELTIDELRYVTMLPDTFETLLYEGGYIVQVNHKGIFSYNKEFISMSLIEVEKFIWYNYAKKNYTR